MMIGTCERGPDLAAHVDARDLAAASRRAARAPGATASNRSIASAPSAAVSTRKPSRCERDARARRGTTARRRRRGSSGGSAISDVLRAARTAAPLPAGEREPERERRAFAFARLDGDLAAVGLRDVAHDREPEAGAAGVAAAGPVDAVEALEDALEVAASGCRCRGRARRSRRGRRRRSRADLDRLPGSEYLIALSSRLIERADAPGGGRTRSRRRAARCDLRAAMPGRVGRRPHAVDGLARRARRPASARASATPAPRSG